MMWHEVAPVADAALIADAELVAALGGTRVAPMESNTEDTVPRIRWKIISDTETETYNPIVIRYHYWAATRALAATIEQRIRRVLHSKVRRTLGGIEMATLYVDSRDEDDPTQGVVHRSIDFRFEPVKRR